MPSFLKEGDQVQIIAPAKFVDQLEINYAIEILKNSGFKVNINENLFNKNAVFSGTKQERINNIQSAFENKNIKAIFFARGGYGCIQIIDHINFNHFIKTPKWLVGFSDATTILVDLHVRHKINSIHGPMPYNFKQTNKDSIKMTINTLKGKKPNIKIKYHNLNKLGKSSGLIVGGNLSILCSMLGSLSFLDLKNDYILFIEDVDEHLYQIDRMVHTLYRAGVLKRIKGLIVGQITGVKDNEISFGKTAYEIIQDITKEYNYPVCFNFPIGHGEKNHPVIIGAKINLEVNNMFSEMHYE